MPQLAAQIWADGPSATPFEPPKPDIREWGTWIEQIIAGIIANGSHGLYQTRASLFADLAHPANYSAWVFGDPTVAYNGLYMKVGASGTGSWTRVGDLPYSFINAYDIGAGTPNAIQATTSIPVTESALIIANIFEANTGSPVTISFNGGGLLTIKSNTGNDVAPGGLVADMRLLGVVSGSTFRLVSDQVSSAIVAAAEAYANAAAASAAAAAAAAAGVNLPPVAANRMLVDNAAGTARESKTFPQVAALLSPFFSQGFSTLASAMAFSPVSAPDYIRTAGYSVAGDNGGALYAKVGSQPSHAGKFSITLSGGGTQWYELSRGQPIFAEMFGAVAHQTDAAALAGGAADSSTAILNAIAFLRGAGISINDGLTNKTITAYPSLAPLNFGAGIFNVAAGAIRITQDLNLVLHGRGSRGKTNYVRAATTILVTGSAASSAYGIQAYGNGSRGFRPIDMDICYAVSGFVGNVLSLIGSPGSYPERCMIGTFGVGAGTRLQTARSCISLSYDEFFNPKECVLDGAQIFIKIEDDNRLAQFTGSITGSVLTVTAVASGELGVGLSLWDAGVALGRSITSLGTGTGGVGTYNLSGSGSLASRPLEADLSWGGSNSHISDCVFYDCSNKSIEFRGARNRTRQGVKNCIVNPINVNANNGYDFRNVDGLALNNNDHVGSVGNAPINGWLYIENCTGKVDCCVFGQATLGITFTNALFDVSNNNFAGNAGYVVNSACVITGKNNEFVLSAAGKGMTVGAPSGGSFLDIGPDRFGTNVTLSYEVPSGTTKGRIYRATSYDNSTSGAAVAAAGVTLTSV